MLVLIYNDNIDTNIRAFCSYEELNTFLFNPAVDTCYTIIDTKKLPGKTYNFKQLLLREQAISYSNNAGNAPLTWDEYAAITNYFSKYGRRYGLIREFTENGII